MWTTFCKKMIADVTSGRSIAPFDRDNLAEIEEMLALLTNLLSWKGESLIRFASSLLCRDSKRLEELQGRLEVCLSRHYRRDHQVIGRPEHSPEREISLGPWAVLNSLCLMVKLIWPFYMAPSVFAYPILFGEI